MSLLFTREDLLNSSLQLEFHPTSSLLSEMIVSLRPIASQQTFCSVIKNAVMVFHTNYEGQGRGRSNPRFVFTLSQAADIWFDEQTWQDQSWYNKALNCCEWCHSSISCRWRYCSNLQHFPVLKNSFTKQNETFFFLDKCHHQMPCWHQMELTLKLEMGSQVQIFRGKLYSPTWSAYLTQLKIPAFVAETHGNDLADNSSSAGNRDGATFWAMSLSYFWW